MRDWLVVCSEHAIVLINGMALILIVFATLEAFVRSVPLFLVWSHSEQAPQIWLRFARWLVAGLTFQLAADIIETSITTNWESVGRIAVIALIRTFLNYFLDRDLNEIGARQRDADHPKVAS